MDKTTKKAAKPATKRPSKPAKPAAPKRASATKEDRDLFTKGVIALAHDRGGISSGDVMSIIGISRGMASRAIREAIDKKKLYRSGERKFTRYAHTQRKADKASAAARGLA